MVKKKKHSVLRVRRTNKTERSRLGSMIFSDKKKKQSKEWCKENYNVFN